MLFGGGGVTLRKRWLTCGFSYDGDAVSVWLDKVGDVLSSRGSRTQDEAEAGEAAAADAMDTD